MNLSCDIALPSSSSLVTIDPVIKILLLLAWTVSVFLVGSWVGIFALSALCLIAVFVSHVPIRTIAKALVPVIALMVVTVAFNALSFDPYSAQQEILQSKATMAGWLGCLPVMASESFALGIAPAGLGVGLFYAARIGLLVAASLLVSLTSKSADLTRGLARLLRPLKILKVPVDDIATVLMLALRFIPLTAEELHAVRMAQEMRGAMFGVGGPFKRLKAWLPVFVPFFVRLFRRAESIATSMDSRCYGYAEQRGSLVAERLGVSGMLQLLTGTFVLLTLGFLL